MGEAEQRVLIDELTGPAATAIDVVGLARTALRADAALVWARRQSSLHTQHVDLGGVQRDPPLRVDLAMGEGVAGISAESRIPIVVRNLADSVELRRLGVDGLAHQPVVEELGWQSAIYVPIEVDSRLLGVLAAYSRQLEKFSEDDIRIVGLFAERIAARIRIGDMNTRFERMVRIGTAAMTRAHDIREDTGSIQTQVDALRKRLAAGDSPESIEKRLDAIKGTARNSQKLAEQTLRQVVSDRARPRLTPVKPIVESIVNDRIVRANEERIYLDHRCESGLAVVTWRREFERALANLVDNAIFFVARNTSGRRQIEVSASIVRLADGSPGNAATILVKDTGPGIPPAERSKVFDFGYTGKGSWGLGIGLSYVESVIEACGGQIEILSDHQYNTIFQITLPAAAKE